VSHKTPEISCMGLIDKDRFTHNDFNFALPDTPISFGENISAAVDCNGNDRGLCLHGKEESSFFEGKHLCAGAPSSLGKKNHRNAPLDFFPCLSQASHGMGAAGAVYNNVFRGPKSPSEEWDKDQFSFRDPPKLKLWEALNQRWDIYVALMIRHEDVRATRIQMVEALDF
jgi:hypothetical protein